MTRHRPDDQLTILRFVACDPALAAVGARQRELLHAAGPRPVTTTGRRWRFLSRRAVTCPEGSP